MPDGGGALSGRLINKNDLKKYDVPDYDDQESMTRKIAVDKKNPFLLKEE